MTMNSENARHSAERARDLLVEPTYSLRSACHCSGESLEPMPGLYRRVGLEGDT
jgi:hypothetical protein